jgi:hypothetical protein
VILYTNLVPKPHAAYTIGPLILIRPEYRDDIGLLEHERTHVRQFWANPLRYSLSFFVADWRLEYEVEAYREQLKHSPNDRLTFAGYLVDRYKLDITIDEALEKLE